MFALVVFEWEKDLDVEDSKGGAKAGETCVARRKTETPFSHLLTIIIIIVIFVFIISLRIFLERSNLHKMPFYHDDRQ